MIINWFSLVSNDTLHRSDVSFYIILYYRRGIRLFLQIIWWLWVIYWYMLTVTKKICFFNRWRCKQGYLWGCSATRFLWSNRNIWWRKNWIWWSFLFASKWQRWNFQYLSDCQVSICCWKDSVVLSIELNYLTFQPVGKTKRFCWVLKKWIQSHLMYIFPLCRLYKNVERGKVKSWFARQTSWIILTCVLKQKMVFKSI